MQLAKEKMAKITILFQDIWRQKCCNGPTTNVKFLKSHFFLFSKTYCVRHATHHNLEFSEILSSSHLTNTKQYCNLQYCIVNSEVILPGCWSKNVCKPKQPGLHLHIEYCGYLWTMKAVFFFFLFNLTVKIVQKSKPFYPFLIIFDSCITADQNDYVKCVGWQP